MVRGTSGAGPRAREARFPGVHWAVIIMRRFFFCFGFQIFKVCMARQVLVAGWSRSIFESGPSIFESGSQSLARTGRHD